MDDLPMIGVFRHAFGDVELSGEFIAEAAAKWPGEHVVRLPAWCDEDEPILSRQPIWHEHVFDGLDRLLTRAWISGHAIRRVKSLAALEI